MLEASNPVVEASQAYSILDAWQDDDSATRKAQCRQHERRPFKTRVEVIVLSMGAEVIVPAYCRDISVGGLGFGSRRPFKFEEFLAVRLPLRLVLCQVRYTRYLARGMYGIGVMFQKVLQAQASTPVPDEWILQAGGHVARVKLT